MKPTHIIVHHSKTTDSDTLSWNAIRDYHKGLGWSDIGYHYGIEFVRDDYVILVGRMQDDTGAHCRESGMNGRSLGICCVGDFDKEAPPVALLHKLRALVVSLMRVFDIPAENVKGHRDYAPYKSCPGRLFDLDKFRDTLLFPANDF